MSLAIVSALAQVGFALKLERLYTVFVSFHVSGPRLATIGVIPWVVWAVQLVLHKVEAEHCEDRAPQFYDLVLKSPFQL